MSSCAGEHGSTPLDDIVLEFNDADGDGSGAATLSTRYVHGPQFDQVLASETVSGNVVTWTLTDHQGTVRDMIRYASGTTTIVNHRKFDAFGNLTAESDPTVKFLHSYTGREWDADAGLMYYRARWYDTTLGWFISEDPIGFAAGDGNLSRYVDNDPANGTDPTGLDTYWGTFLYSLPSAYGDTLCSGKQYDSLLGSTHALVDTMSLGYTDITRSGPLYGNEEAYKNGQVVGQVWGVANYVALAAFGAWELAVIWTARNPSVADRAAAVLERTGAQERYISYFHRGTLELGNGRLSSALDLSTSRCRATVEVLRPGQPPGILEFRVPERIIQQWELN